jgi:hypothetical protein
VDLRVLRKGMGVKSVEGPEPFDADWHLRREWWLNHTHPISALYGDDGELQCHACPADFKREPLEKLYARVHGLRIERGIKAIEEAPS